MISKLAFTAAALYEAQAALITPSSEAITAGMTCQECLTMANSQYCTPQTTYRRHDTVTGHCISSSESCESLNSIKVGPNGIVEAAQLACPTRTDVCGDQWFTIAPTGISSIASPRFRIDSKSGCTYGFVSTCGAPVVGSYIEDEAKIALFHYTKDSRVSSTDLAVDSESAPTDFPSTTSPLHDLEANCQGAQNSITNSDGTQWMFRKASDGSIVKTTDILHEYDDYLGKVKTYQGNYLEYQYNVQQYKNNYYRGFLYELLFSVRVARQEATIEGAYEVQSTYPGDYTGRTWKDLTSLGGWGDMSVQTMNLESRYEYGTFGSVTKPRISSSVDINPTECVKRYAIVSLYNSDTYPMSSTYTTFWAISSSLAPNVDAFSAPENSDKYYLISGAMAKSIGAAALFGTSVASMF